MTGMAAALMNSPVVGRGGGAGGAGKFKFFEIFWLQIQIYVNSRTAGSSSSSAGHAAFIAKIVSDLKSRNELDRHRAAR